MLIGHYTDTLDVARVTDVSGPPADSGSGRTWFRRGVSGLASLLRRHWSGARRTHYVGEWHYHPAVRVDASPEDLQQMRSISESAQFQCSEPVMLILGQCARGGVRPFKAFVFPKDGPYEEFREDTRCRVPGLESP